MQNLIAASIAAALAAAASVPALAQHADIAISIENGRIVTSADLGAGPVAQRVFSADFGALGVPDFTDENFSISISYIFFITNILVIV